MKGFYNSEIPVIEERLTVELSNKRKEELDPRRQRVNNKIQSIRQSFVAQTRVKPIKNKPAEPGIIDEQVNTPKL